VQWATNRQQERENTELVTWAHSLEGELRAERQRTGELELEVERRIEWARSLEQELERCRAWGGGLVKDVESRTLWAQDLDRQLEDRTKWAAHLEALVKRLETDLGALRATFWNRLGRLLRFVR
jgi:hypothetical protein